jgi:hypothetical protein
MDAALVFDVQRFDIVRRDRGPMMTPEVLDLTDVDPLPAQPDASRMDRPCTAELPGDYRFYAEGPGAPFDDRVTLGLPRRFRFERRLPGMTTPRVCETSIPACGAADMVDVDEVAEALSDPAVTMALGARETLFGCDARLTGGVVLVVERGANRAVVGEPCRVCMREGCVPAPMPLQRLTDVLVALRDQELLRPVCRDIATRDAGPPADAPRADVTSSPDASPPDANALADAPADVSPDLPRADVPAAD